MRSRSRRWATRPIRGRSTATTSTASRSSSCTRSRTGRSRLALVLAAAGDGTLIRALVDENFYGRNPDDGTFDPGADRFFTIYGAEAHWPRDIRTYLREGNQAWGVYDHFFSNHGYSELNLGLYPWGGRCL